MLGVPSLPIYFFLSRAFVGLGREGEEEWRTSKEEEWRRELYKQYLEHVYMQYLEYVYMQLSRRKRVCVECVVYF